MRTYRDVVAIGSSLGRADDLERIEDVGDESVGLGDEVVDRLHVASESTRSDEGADEESTVGRVVLADGVVDVHLAVLGRAGLEGEVGEAGELELEGESGLDISDRRQLLPRSRLLAEGEERRVLALATDEERETTHASTLDLVVGGVDVLCELRAEGVLVDGAGRLGHGEGDVDHVPLRLARRLRREGLLDVGDVSERRGELLAEVVEV